MEKSPEKEVINMNTEKELVIPNNERVVTVVGGMGQLGRKIVKGFQSLKFGQVRICEEGDSFLSFVEQSTDIFFAVDDKKITAMLHAADELLTPQHAILDGSSVKEPLIPVFKRLDDRGVSVVSTHLGAIPSHPWRGVKVWICTVGPNSERAKRLAIDLFISTNSSIEIIDIAEHKNVEMAQWMTMVSAHLLAGALREIACPLGRFSSFSTLNSELQTLPLGRTLGQGTKVPSEIIHNQPMRERWFEAMEKALAEMRDSLDEKDSLQQLMEKNIEFHNNDGSVDAISKKAGIIGARNANLRMHRFSFRITDDRPGRLLEALKPFHIEGVNLTAIDSMSGIATDEEIKKDVDPDSIVDFDIGIDPKTIDEEKEQRIREKLIELGCSVR